MLDVQGHCYVGNESYPGSGRQLMVASFHAVRPSTAPRWRCDPEELVLKRHHDVEYPKRDHPTAPTPTPTPTPTISTPSYSRRDTSFSEPLVSHSSHSMTSIDVMHETRLGCKDDVLWRVMRCGFLAGRLAGYCLSSTWSSVDCYLAYRGLEGVPSLVAQGTGRPEAILAHRVQRNTILMGNRLSGSSSRFALCHIHDVV